MKVKRTKKPKVIESRDVLLSFILFDDMREGTVTVTTLEGSKYPDSEQINKALEVKNVEWCGLWSSTMTGYDPNNTIIGEIKLC